MNSKMLTPDLSVMPQVSEADIAELSRRGFKSIISNRPDGEAADQPAWSTIAAAAQSHGMEARHIPVVASQIDDDDVAAFTAALRDLPTPIAAFCRTGTRAALLWALAIQRSRSVDERIRVAASRGFDLEPFRARIEQPSTSTPSVGKGD
ncbi:MAG: TIGR01244 family phosphatase [Sphingomonas bacterium]|nr:TIGR01244 family phosphatase [Sphingomonas bacterium]